MVSPEQFTTFNMWTCARQSTTAGPPPHRHSPHFGQSLSFGLSSAPVHPGLPAPPRGAARQRGPQHRRGPLPDRLRRQSGHRGGRRGRPLRAGGSAFPSKRLPSQSYPPPHLLASISVFVQRCVFFDILFLFCFLLASWEFGICPEQRLWPLGKRWQQKEMEPCQFSFSLFLIETLKTFACLFGDVLLGIKCVPCQRVTVHVSPVC